MQGIGGEQRSAGARKIADVGSTADSLRVRNETEVYYRGRDMEPTNEVQPLRLEHAFERQEAQFARAFALVEKGIEARVTPGAVLAVTSHGELVAWKAFGRFRYEDDAPAVEPETVFDLASLTKAVATTSVAMLLYERGLLKMRTKVREFFREFEDGGKREITIADLLSHSSGLPAYEKLFLRCRTREQVVGAAAAAPLVNPPGSRSKYSDLGFLLLGEILSRLAGTPLDAFVASEITRPLGMTSALYAPPKDMREAIPPTQEDRDFRKRTIQGEVDDENASMMERSRRTRRSLRQCPRPRALCGMPAARRCSHPEGRNHSAFHQAPVFTCGIEFRARLGYAFSALAVRHLAFVASLRTSRVHRHFDLDRSGTPSLHHAAHQPHVAAPRIAGDQAATAGSARRARRESLNPL